MKKLSLFLAVLMLTVWALPGQALALTAPKTVRIGLESLAKAAQSLSFTNQEIQIGEEVKDEFLSIAAFSSASGFTAQKVSETYVRIVSNELNYDNAKETADTLGEAGISAVPAYTGQGLWSVFVPERQSNEISDYETKSANASVLLSSGGRMLCITDASVSLQLAARDADGILTIQQKPYRGRMELLPDGGGLTPVNIVGLEEYLYSVVPSEMPASFDLEALKAQAVAARTYVMGRLGAAISPYYDMDDTIKTQVYKGVSQEHARSTQAVDATAGVFMTYQGKPIEALFFASSGGYTENSENVWTNVTPYLRGVPEVDEPNVNVWTKSYTLNDLDTLLAKQGDQIGKATNLVIAKTSEGGRVQELHIVGTQGTKVLTRESIRTYFSPLGGSLPSKMFTIDGQTTQTQTSATAPSPTTGRMQNLTAAVAKNGIVSLRTGRRIPITGITVSEQASSSASTSSAPADGTFVLNGRGNGHGVGLSQRGAQGLAATGRTYEQILKYYYTGIDLES